MRILILNQAFYPDVVATAQHGSDLAIGLKEAGHEIYVIASARGYDDPATKFTSREVWNGIHISRVASFSFGKSSKIGRAANFASFVAACCLRLTSLPKFDAVIALTSPPLISFVAACFKRITGAKLLYWTMDLNPDEAIAAGWLERDSLVAKALTAAHRFSLQSADEIVVLDRFMKDRVSSAGARQDRVTIVPPWSHDDVAFNEREREQFREANGLSGKFVVMYSGNHSPCHPLNTILGAAKILSDDEKIRFLFVGGGSQFPVVRDYASRERLNNILCLPYQPKDKLAGSLSAADVHLVVMGEPFVGIVHPCKIYNILAIGSPFLYIGPSPSHVTDLVEQLGGESNCIGSLRHGEISALVTQIRIASQDGKIIKRTFRTGYSSGRLIPIFVSQIEKLQNKTQVIEPLTNTVS